MTTMRAKMYITAVQAHEFNGKVTGETVHFAAVGKSGSYPDDGSDEDNTFARWTPNADAHFSIQNPALFGQYKVGQKFYFDVTPVEGNG